MITTSIVQPAAELAAFVNRYVYREFSSNGKNVTKPKHAVQEIAMHFFFEGLPVKLTEPVTGKILKTGKHTGVSGLSSKFVGEMTFNGFYSFFEIAFNPHGFQYLFNIPATEFTDQIVWGEEIFPNGLDELHDMLCYCHSVQQMGDVTDKYLTALVRKQRNLDRSKKISHIISTINRRKGLVDIDKLATEVHMSPRNFERVFMEYNGVPAKLYCCITRFNHALDLKLKNPGMRWTNIAHDTGYFDQTHLVKEFKRFCGEAPAALLKETPLLVEHIIEDG